MSWEDELMSQIRDTEEAAYKAMLKDLGTTQSALSDADLYERHHEMLWLLLAKAAQDKKVSAFDLLKEVPMDAYDHETMVKALVMWVGIAVQRPKLQLVTCGD